MSATTSRSEGRLDWPQLLEEALTLPGSVTGVYDRFYPYSFLNVVNLWHQGVAEPVATLKRWNAIGRKVLKGAKAKEIIRPIIITRDNDLGEPEQAVVGFKPIRCIFTLSQTEGPELPPLQMPEWDLQAALGTLGIKEVAFEHMDGNVQGVSRGLELAINPIAVHPLKTRFHEIAHIVLGHTLPHRFEEYRTHRGIMEYQSEAIAYLCMNELGLMDEETATHSRGYIQHWLRGEKPGDQAIRQVFTATDRILKAGRPVDSESVGIVGE